MSYTYEPYQYVCIIKIYTITQAKENYESIKEKKSRL